MTETRIIISGNFIEGEYVIVNIDGNIVRRKVYWSVYVGDFYVTYDGVEYFKREFSIAEEV